MHTTPAIYLDVSTDEDFEKQKVDKKLIEKDILCLIDEYITNKNTSYDEPFEGASAGSFEWGGMCDLSTAAYSAISESRNITPKSFSTNFNNSTFLNQEVLDYDDDHIQPYDELIGRNIQNTLNFKLVKKLVKEIPNFISSKSNMSNIEGFLRKFYARLDYAKKQIFKNKNIHTINAFNRGNVPVVNRWRNLDLILPIFIPSCRVDMAVQNNKKAEKTDESTIHFVKDGVKLTDEHQNKIIGVVYPTKNDKINLFTSSDTLSELFSSSSYAETTVITPINAFCTRIAVIHKCPDFIIPFLADALLATVPMSKLNKPINLKCTRISRCSVKNRKYVGKVVPSIVRNSDKERYHNNTFDLRTRMYDYPTFYNPNVENWQERIEALIEPETQQDSDDLNLIGSYLSHFAYVINEPIKKMLISWYQEIISVEPVPSELYNKSTRKLGFELRWAPSKQMKIVLANRLSQCSNSLITSPVDIKGIVLNEIRLVHERKVELEWDPAYEEETVLCKMIIRSTNKELGRILFSNQNVSPKINILPMDPSADEFIPKKNSIETKF